MRKYNPMRCNPFSHKKWQNIDYSDAGKWQVDDDGHYFRWFAGVKEYAPEILRTDEYFRIKKERRELDDHDN